MAIRVLVLADTHVSVDPARLPRRVWDEVARADLVLHAGDVITDPLLDALEAEAPLHCVLGNNDYSLRARLPETLRVEVGGVRIAILHDAGPAPGRPQRMLRRFPATDLVIHGHTHLPEIGPRVDGLCLFNPGSPTHRRRAPTHTFGVVEIADGEIRHMRIVEC